MTLSTRFGAYGLAALLMGGVAGAQVYTGTESEAAHTEALAENYGERVIAILLSGMGDDGVSGMIAVKQRNGLTAVQSRGEAAYETMPAQAILRDHVDLELSAEKLAEMVIRLCQGKVVSPAFRGSPPLS